MRKIKTFAFTNMAFDGVDIIIEAFSRPEAIDKLCAIVKDPQDFVQD